MYLEPPSPYLSKRALYETLHMMDVPSQDDFKWFGEGFDGFPKHLPQDCVVYAVYIINSKLTDVQVRENLVRFEKAASQLCKQLLKDYIWQRDHFELKLERQDKTWILRGQTNFGDSIADEWLIVYLLRTLSKDLEDAWIRIYDNDGEFLLIEAADALPGWLTPEVGFNRVWLRDGQFHIIPLHQPLTKTSETQPLKRPLTIDEAILFISQQQSKLTRASQIQDEAFYRIRNYPAEISNCLHTAAIRIPRNIAYILKARPTFVSLAIESFYLRDPISLGILEKNQNELVFPPSDVVTASVRFNRVGYAQLYSQGFQTPKIWASVMAAATDAKASKQIDIGMKLTCGFEMLMKDPKNQDKREVREITLLLEDVANGDEQLPADEHIKAWSRPDDDDAWLDIDYEEMDNVLAGSKGKPQASNGFGSATTMEDMRKMAERFEEFLNDDQEDDMDVDDEDSDDDEDDDVSFNEQDFAKLMREMMGMPSAAEGEESPEKSGLRSALQQLANVRPQKDAATDQTSDDAELRELSDRMEAELHATGALDLNPTPRKLKAIKSGRSTGQAKSTQNADDSSNEEKDDADGVHIDLELAQNLLQSLQGHAGMPGPAGNLMSMMNMDKRDRS